MIYSGKLSSVSEDSKPAVIEAEITVPIIVNYIVDVLVHYTKFKSDGSLNLREYLNEVYVKIVDIWGFITSYYPILEMLYNNYFSLKENEMKILKKIEYIFNEYLYNRRHEPIDVNNLMNDLNELGNLIHIGAYDKKKTSTQIAGKIKTHKTKKRIDSSINSFIFKRKKLIKRFKNPFFLTIK